MNARILLVTALVPALAALTSGCTSSDDETETKTECDARAKLDGVCPGVTSAAISTGDLACTSTIEAANQADADSKGASATAGACIVLTGTAYNTIKLPAGVHLIGKGAGTTKVEGVSYTGAAGKSATVRGLEVGKAGVVATGGGSLTLDLVRVKGSSAIGVSAFDTSLALRASTIEGNAGSGIESTCTNSCTPRLTLSLQSVHLTGNKRAGILAQDVDVSLNGVQIDKTQLLDFLFGRGVEVSSGGSLVAKNLAVLKNEGVGIFVDGGTADLSGFASSGNQRGVQLQAVKVGKLDNFDVLDNSALGIGITKGAEGIVVQGGRVASTTMLDVPVDIGGIDAVGDGINWLDGSDVKVESNVKIESSARRGVIISSTSKGSFAGTLAGGDEKEGIVVQGGLEPSMPTGLSITDSVKSSVLTKDKAMPVAMAVSAALKKTR